MNTHDIELPPLPRPQVPLIDADIDLMDIRRLADWCEKTAKEYARAAIEADRQRRGPLTVERIRTIWKETMPRMGCGGDPVLWFARAIERAHGISAPQPAESCESLMRDKTPCGSENGNCDSQPAEPVKINAIFETEDGPFIGKTDAKVKRVEVQDDGALTVVIDHWPQPAEPVTVPEGYVLIAEDYLEAMIGPERMDHLRRSCRFLVHKHTPNTQPAEPVSQHPDDAAVDAFATAMKAKLKRAREEKGRGGWQDMSATALSAMLREHVEKGDPVDVANFAMMLHQNGQGIVDGVARVEALLREALAALKAENEMLRESLKDADNELDWLDEEMDTCDHSVGVCMCSYWNMRRKMKAALAKDNSND